MAKQVVVSGYFGFGNIGDEAVLAGMAESFRQAGIDANIVALSNDPAKTVAQHVGITSRHRYRPMELLSSIVGCDVFISGGGSLLQDVTSAHSAFYYLAVLNLAHLLGKKTVFYAQGVGPLNSQRTRRAVAKALNRMTGLSVRDPDSKRLLEQIGVKPQICLSADPAFMLKADVDRADALITEMGLSDKPVIGVSLRPWGESSDWLPAIRDGLSRLASELGAHILLLPMREGEDTVVCEALGVGQIARCGEDACLMKGLIRRCKMVLGMRLHSLIFAASEAVPFVPVVYDPKVSSFAKLAGASYQLNVDSLNTQVVFDGMQAVWDDADHFSEGLASFAREQKRLAMESALLVKRIIDG